MRPFRAGDPTPQALAVEVTLNGCITLPKTGSQGYVYIPFQLSDIASPLYTGSGDKLYQIQMQVRDFGGALGSFLNAPRTW